MVENRTSANPKVRVEFFGLARSRTEIAQCELDPGTVLTLAQKLDLLFPRLYLLQAHRLSTEYLISIDGVLFCDNLNQPVGSNQSLLILSKDAGG